MLFVAIQLLGKFLDGYDHEFRPVNVLKDVEVGVVGDDVLGIGSHGTVHELVVVGIDLNQSEVDIDLLIDGGVEASDGLDHVVGYLAGGFPSEDFLVLIEYLGVHAQADAASEHLGPYLVIRTAAGQYLQQAVGVKNDAPHRCRGCACALHPIARWFPR